MASIFDKQRLTPGQLVTVAERRFLDAQALCDTGRNVHGNGAQYLGGFVIEILLKSQLIRRHPSIARKRPHERLSPEEQEVWSLIYRSHDLDEMLGRLPELAAVVQKRGERDGQPYLTHLRSICGSWTIFARYSSRSTDIGEARKFLDRVREVKEVLK
jgi:hypothetical protein